MKPIWTLFWDMHSGGGTKVAPYDKIYIEAESQKKAEQIFEDRFNRSPYNVTCECCGEDYSVSTAPDLAQATGYHRHCHYEDGRYIEEPQRGRYASSRAVVPLEEYKRLPNVLIIPLQP